MRYELATEGISVQDLNVFSGLAKIVMPAKAVSLNSSARKVVIVCA